MPYHYITHSLFWVLLLVSLVVTIGEQTGLSATKDRTFLAANYPSNHIAPHYTEFVFSTADYTQTAHSPSLTQISDGRLMAVWYGGSREGAKDVALYSAQYDLDKSAWHKAEILVKQQEVEEDVGVAIKKLGNPVIYRDSQDRLWCFFVGVSIGGWSGSSIYVKRSHDQGQTWSAVTSLKTSPFFNISTLVRNSPFELTNGLIGLPVYHEFLGKYAEILYITPELDVIDKQRLTWGRHSLQPEIIPVDSNSAVNLMRYSGKRPKQVLLQHTVDAGRSWSQASKSELANPNTPVAGIALDAENILVGFNNQRYGRTKFALAMCQANPFKCKTIKQLESALHRDDVDVEFSYPDMLVDNRGQIHLVYSHYRNGFKHLVFNTQWLESQINDG